MQSTMKNQRSSPAKPRRFTSTRQALYLALLALHFAFISLSFSIVSFILDGLTVAGAAVVAAGAAAGAVVWAEAVWSVPATSSMTARQVPVRSIGKFPWGQFVELDGKTKGAAGRIVRPAGHAMFDQNILPALSSVFHTPQASGMPTKAQNSAALT